MLLLLEMAIAGVSPLLRPRGSRAGWEASGRCCLKFMPPPGVRFLVRVALGVVLGISLCIALAGNVLHLVLARLLVVGVHVVRHNAFLVPLNLVRFRAGATLPPLRVVVSPNMH